MTLLDTIPRTVPSDFGMPPREITDYLPLQGNWTEHQYITIFTKRGVEFNGGMLEVLPVPTLDHQLILQWFFKLLEAFVAGRGIVVTAGYKLRVQSQEVQFREPDVVYLAPDNMSHAGQAFTRAAELVVEVVSPDDPSRDYLVKRGEYATAGIPEYWILDPAAKRILVLGLQGSVYVECGTFSPGQQAASHHLPGFAVAVDDMLAQVQTTSESK